MTNRWTKLTAAAGGLALVVSLALSTADPAAAQTAPAAPTATSTRPAAKPKTPPPAPAEKAYQAVLNCDKFIVEGGTGEDYCWMVGYDLDVFVKGYKATHDTAWLDAGAKAYEHIVGLLAAGPDGYKGWIGVYEFDKTLWQDSLVGDAYLWDRILRFSELVLADETLKQTYGEAANRYVAMAKREFVEKFDQRGTWHKDGPFGAYEFWDTFATVKDQKTWAKHPEAILGSVPFNKQNAAGLVMLELYRITGDKAYHDRAQRIFALFKSRLQLVGEGGDYYAWNYWEPIGPWDLAPDLKDTARKSGWIGQNKPRYQKIEVAQVVEAYNTGVVFDRQDMEWIVKTFDVMWNHDKDNPQFRHSNWGYLGVGLTPEQLKAREAKPYEKDFYATGFWAALDQFSQTVRDLEPGTIKKYDAVSKEYFDNVVLKTPPSFDRLYPQIAATPFAWPLRAVQTINCAAVMPCTITKGKPSLVFSKVCRAEDLETAVYSSDGQTKLFVLKQEKIDGSGDGHAGFQILQWDGADPAGQVKLPAGGYRVRWTAADGYREFPVTLAGEPTKAAATAPAARIELFNGKDLHQWKFVEPDMKTDPETVWKTIWTVKDGVLHFAGKPNINLQTRAAYRDYQLHVEWRWPEGKGNSGVFLHVNKDSLCPPCVEAQLCSTHAGDFLIDGTAKWTKDPTVIVIPRREASSEKPFGEWNSYDIVCRGNTITVRVNGVLQNEVEGVAERSGALLSSGAIALQAEGKTIDFRNIWIEPLAKP